MRVPVWRRGRCRALAAAAQTGAAESSRSRDLLCDRAAACVRGALREDAGARGRVGL